MEEEMKFVHHNSDTNEIHPQFLELLIKEVEKRPALYRFKNTVSQETERKLYELWLEIYNYFGGVISITELKRKWKAQRDRYVKVRAHMKKCAKDITVKPMKFRYYNMMRFLDETLDAKERDRNIIMDTCVVSPSLGNGQQVKLHPLAMKNILPNRTNSLLLQTDDETSTNIAGISKSCQRIEESLSHIKEEILTEVKKPVVIPEPSKMDEVDGFCLRVAGSLRRMNPKDRAEVEIQILQLLLSREVECDDNLSKDV